MISSRTTRFILFVLLPGANLLAQQPRIFINEFLASNVTTDADIVDFDDYSDWIELYNDEDSEVDLGDFSLTDNLDNPSRWKIPSGTVIAAKGFLRFWADGYDDVPGKTYRRSYYPFDYFTTRYFHLNFKLDRAGESLGLFDPAAALVDSVSYALQLPDVSGGRSPDGSAHWVWFGEPTPAAANTTSGASTIDFCDEPNISLQSGFYAGPQTINIAASSDDAEIRFTFDGSRPGSSSASYTGPLHISRTSVLRVRVFAPDKLPSPIVSRTYFIDENIRLPVISIAHFPETFWDSTSGIYRKNFKEREVPIHFEYFEAGGNLGFTLNAGLQLTGQASLYYPQKSFTINTDDRFGADVIDYQIFPQRKLNQFTSLYLRNAGVPDHRSTFFRDALQHSLVLNKLDIDCQAYQPALAFLNGDYWGILNIRDKINENYLASTYNLDPDDIDLLEYESNPQPTIMSGDAANYLAFYDYVKSTDLSVEENYRRVGSWMDVDEYLDYQISEIFCDNVFWLDQNVRMWRERKDGAKWRWILFDMDYGFGMPNQISKGVSNNTLRFATSSNPDTPGVPPLWATLLFRKLLENEEFKVEFIQRFASCLNSVFHPDTVLGVINQLQDRIAPEMPRHIARWRNGEFYYGYPIADYATWLQNVNVMKDFARNRPAYQRQHLIDYFGLSGIFQLNLKLADSEMGSIRINEIERITANRSGPYFKNVPTELKAIPNVGYRFVRWEGAVNSDQNPISLVVSGDSAEVTARFEPVSINIIPPRISFDTTFDESFSPYYAQGTVTVDSGATLRLKSGVQLLMPESANLIVRGRLLVEGSQENPVIIAPNENSSHWGALCFVNAADSSIVSHLNITGATKGPDFDRDRAAISGYHSRFSLHNVSVDNVQAPVFAQFGNVSITDCFLHTTMAGDLINVKSAGFVLVEHCELRGNESYDSDGVDLDHVVRGIIRGNRIYNIYGFNSDAIDLGEGCPNVLIENNVIYNVADKGISIGGASVTTIKRNVIANCGQGAGIKDFNSYGRFEHNTFYANQQGIACFEKNIGHGGGNAEVVGCIIANSVLASTFVDGLSRLEVSYSLSNTDELPGLSNIRAEPGFMNNLLLSPHSPAIDRGDPALPHDPDGSPPDIGAFPFVAGNLPNLIITEIHYHPAEGDEYEFIELLNAGSAAIKLDGLKSAGDVIHTFHGEEINSGEYVVLAKNAGFYQIPAVRILQWDTGTLRNGPGSILLFDDQERLIDFVNYDRRFWWPEAADGHGPSLELIDTSLENMVSDSWRSSFASGGSPGRANNSVPLSGIHINEFLAANSQTLADENGDYDDWIELYNATDLPLNVGGLCLTDNLDVPCKSLIPTHSPALTTIPARGFILLWADGQPEQGALHLSFKLDKAGEQLGLAQIMNVDTVLIDSLTYGEQMEDISYGRNPDGADHWVFLGTPTPLKSNETTGLEPENPSLPAAYSLLQNFPNPFNPLTKIRYQLPVFGHVSLKVYDVLGWEIVTLVDEDQPAGSYTVTLNATGLASGIYFYKITASKFVQTKKLVLIR